MLARHFSAGSGGQNRFPVLGAEGDMDEKGCIRVGHRCGSISSVPTGLVPLLLRIPGTEVPGYIQGVPPGRNTRAL